MDLRTSEQWHQENFECSLNTTPAFEFLILPENPDEWWWKFINECTSNFWFGTPTHMPNNTDMFDLLVATGTFKSKGDAKKNWTKSDKEIPDGHSMWLIGKKKIPLIIYKACVKFTEEDWKE